MIVVKIGGSQGVGLDAVCRDIADLVKMGQPLIIVHGGSSEMNKISEKLGNPPRFVTNTSGYTSRYTDRNTLEIFAMVTNGWINTHIVENLQKLEVNAIGLSGLDGRLMAARRKDRIRIVENGKQRILHDDYTGKILSVNGDFLKMLLLHGMTPVIAPLAISPSGEGLNVDADRAAAMVAGTMQAEQLIILTNVPGLMRSYPDENTLITQIPKEAVQQAIKFAEGRMKKKVLGASEALELGVPKVVFADGRVEHPLHAALAGTGTVIS